MTDDSLADELRALGRSAVVPPVPDGLATAVIERIAQPPVRRTFAEVVKSKWLALLAVLLAGAVVASPVRAEVASWFNIGGVQAQPVGSGPTSAPPPPAVTGRLTLAEATAQAGFKPIVPKELGAPTGIEASTGMVAMGWDGIRLEQFRAAVSPIFIKKYYQAAEAVTTVDGFWFTTPHELVLADRSMRIAGPTLVWVYGGVTFRLEGLSDKARAVAIAESAVR